MFIKLNYSISFLLILSTYFYCCWSGIDEANNDDTFNIAIHEGSGKYSPSPEGINYLLKKYPKDHFPEKEYFFYEWREKIRLNQDFCEAIKKKPDFFEGFKVYKINKIALLLPECFKVSIVNTKEYLRVDNKEIRLRICEQKIKSLETQKKESNIALAALLNDDLINDKEKVNHLREIFKSDEENNAD